MSTQLDSLTVAQPNTSHPGSLQTPYFADPSLRQRLDLLQHLVEYADLLLVVKGPHGAGKSALLEQLLLAAREEWVICRIDATPLTTRDQFLTLLAQQINLDLPHASLEQLERALVQQLEILRKNDRVALLVVDDAHALAAPVLDLIVKLYGLGGSGGKLLRILLFAEAGLEETIQSPALKPLEQSITHTLDVPPFALEQTRSFLEHLLSSWGSSIQLPLAEEFVENAHQKSEGLPGRLIVATAELMEAEPPETREAKPEATVRRRLGQPQHWAAAGVILLVLVALVFQDDINSLFESDETTLVRADRPGRVELPLPSKTVDERAKTGSTGTHPVGKLPVVEQPEKPSLPEAAPPLVSTELSVPESVAPEIVPEAIPPEPRPEPERPATPVTAETAETAETVEPAEPPVAPPTPKPTIQKPEQTESVDAARNPSTPGIRGHAWITAQPKEYFTLQLFGVRDKSALIEFVADHKLKGPVSILETEFKGAPWFVLLHGSYPNRSAAEQARDRLSQTIRRVKPWPRTFLSVRDQL